MFILLGKLCSNVQWFLVSPGSKTFCNYKEKMYSLASIKEIQSGIQAKIWNEIDCKMQMKEFQSDVTKVLRDLIQSLYTIGVISLLGDYNLMQRKKKRTLQSCLSHWRNQEKAETKHKDPGTLNRIS